MTIITTLSSWQRRMWKDDRDSKGQNICIHCINKRLSNPQKLIFALQQATCHQQQVGIWEIKSSSAVLHGIHFFLDQWLFKRSQLPHRSHESSWGENAWPGLHTPLPFVFTAQQWIPGREGVKTEQGGLDRLPYSNHGVAVCCLWVSWLPRAGSFTHDLLFPPAGESPSSTSDLFFTWFRPLGFVQRLPPRTHKEILHCCSSLDWPYAILRATGNTKHLPIPLGIPPPSITIGKDPSACVEDNESSCALG